MAFLFHRLRTTLTFTNLSLLHHHRHRHLSSTSNSASHFLVRIITTTNPPPSPSLLRHHRRLLSSISGDHLSPSLLSEVRDAIKELHASAYVYQSGPAPSTIKTNPASSSPFSSAVLSFNFNSNSDEESEENDSTSTLDDKFERLKLKALSLNQRRKKTDKESLWKLIESRKALSREILECINLMEKDRRRLNTGKKPPAHEIDTLIMKLTREKEMTVEIVELSKVLTESRLVSFHEMIRNLSRIRKDLHLQQQGDNEEFGKILKELREGLMRGVELEVMQFEVLVKNIGQELASTEQCISNYFHVRDICTCSAYGVGTCRHALGDR